MKTLSRPQVINISLTLRMPDGSTRVNTVDPSDCDALFWSERGAQILGMYYAPGGPTEGKIMSKELLVKHFGPGVEALLNGASELKITPEIVKQLWELDEGEGVQPGYLAKSTINIVNGYFSAMRLDRKMA